MVEFDSHAYFFPKMSLTSNLYAAVLAITRFVHTYFVLVDTLIVSLIGAVPVVHQVYPVRKPVQTSTVLSVVESRVSDSHV